MSTTGLSCLEGCDNGHATKELPKCNGSIMSRVLVVEDNPAVAYIMCRLLEALGHESSSSHDGEEAINVAFAYRPDLFLIDIGLPSIDGYQLTRILRQQPEFEHSMMVALTGYGSDEDILEAEEAGFDLHITKPPDIKALRELLNHPRLNVPDEDRSISDR